jgi:hypothetical protein
VLCPQGPARKVSSFSPISSASTSSFTILVLEFKGTKVPESAAFPNGLPEALEASVALQLLSEGSDSDHSGMPFIPSDLPLLQASNKHAGEHCTCGLTGECNCCTPRKAAPRNRSKGSIDTSTGSTGRSEAMNAARAGGKRPSPTSSRPPSSHILARIAELRPVLPRPTHRSPDVAHDPSSGIAHGHPTRHTHENMFYSPYGRAYEYNHGTEPYYPPESQQNMALRPPSNSSQDSFGDQVLQAAAAVSWIPPVESSPRAFPSLCNCGDSCRCAGCVYHSPSEVTTSAAAYSTCSNPGACSYCLDCSILSLPSSIPPNSALSFYEAQQTHAIDDWIRQVSLIPVPPQLPSVNVSPTIPESLYNFGGPPWDSVQMPGISRNGSQHELNIPATLCCTGGCGCSRGMCQCEDHTHGESECGGGGLTFATSGERLSICKGKRRDPDGNVGLVPDRSVYTNAAGYLSVPNNPRSRSSSTSSHSSGSRTSNNLGHSSVPPGRVEGPRRALYSKGALSIPGPVAAANGSCCTSMQSPTTHSRGSSGDVAYATSNPDSEGSLEDNYSQYDPSLDGMQLY